MIDLHCHTRSSDGEDKPSDLVAKALQKGLSAIAVTDHDTMAGIPAALAAAKGTSLEIVPGIEFSTFHMGREVHILSFFLPFDNHRLNSFLADLTRQREERGRKMIERLNAIGYDLTYAEAAAIADGAPIMSPHIARALWVKGVLKNFEEAAAFYQKHLVLGADVYIPHTVDLRDVLEITHDIKCPIAIAHPHKIGDDAVVADLIKMGVHGMEVYYPETAASALEYYRQWAKREGMFLSGGSDYHGIYSTRQLGSANVPDEVLDGIRVARDRLRG